MNLWDIYLDALALHHGLFSIIAWAATLNVLWWTFVFVVYLVTGGAKGPDRRMAETDEEVRTTG